VRTEFPNKVKRDALQRAKDNGGKCENPGCGAFLSFSKYHYDHVIPDQMGGEATLENCQVICFACHKIKTRKDVADIAKAKRRSDKHNGVRRKSRFAGSRDSKWKMKIGGGVVPR
jgi:5-methylcytosine-specific restriction protein A